MKQKTLLYKSKLFLVGLGLLSISTLSAQTLKHSYTFETGTYDVTTKTVTDVAGTALGSAANGTINGSNWEIKNGYFYNHNSISAATNMGGYISMLGTELVLNTYSAITLEAYITTSNDQNNPTKWSCLAYFGGAAGANSFMLQPEISGGNTKAGVNNALFAIGAEAGANQTHHYVAVLTPSTDAVTGSVALYYDGVLAQSTVLPITTYNAAVSSLATTNAFLGKGGWGDPLFTQPIHEFNIYDGVMDAATVQARYKARNTQLATLTVDAGILAPAFNASVYNYGVILPVGTTSLTVGATTAVTSKAVTGATTYDVSGDYGTITVKADSVGAVPYLINWRKDVATPVLTHSYTFVDGTAKDMVGTLDGTVNGAGVIANGIYTTSAATNFASGTSQYISLPASALAINQYPSISTEAVIKSSNAGYISYFGNQTLQNGTDYYYTFTANTNISTNTNHQAWVGENKATLTPVLSDGKAHHVVSVLTNDSIYLYADGVLKNKTLLSGLNKLFNVSNNVAYLCRSGYPGDLNWRGSMGEFNIFKGKLDATTIASRAANYVKDANITGITVSVGSLTFDPATTSYNVNVPSGTTSVTVDAAATKEFATVTGTGTITLNPGGLATIVVTSGDGSASKTYTINFIPPVPAISVGQTPLSFNSEANTQQTITVSGANLSDVINITAPAGITVNPTSLPANSNGASVSVTYDGVTSVSGNITLASTGATTQTIPVTGVSYVGCFTPLYTTGNLIADSYCSSYLLDGWGTKSINTDPAYIYCGLGSGKIASGSIDRKLNGTNGNAQMLPNTTYRVKAKVYAVSGIVQVGVYGWSNGQSDITHVATTTGAWEDIDFTFTSGATLAANQGIFFNNGTGYIDNWEMYVVTNPATAISTISLEVQNQKVYVQGDKFVVDLKLMKKSNVQFFVYNMQGELLTQTHVKELNAGQITETIAAPKARGLYLVKTIIDGKICVAKIVK